MSCNIYHFQTGVGTELKNLLSKFGLKAKRGCKCRKRACEMNQKGIDWCVENINTIVGWIREEATRANLPFAEIGAKILVRRAIRNAKRKMK